MKQPVYSSGPEVDRPRADLRVHYYPDATEFRLEVTSKVMANFGDSIRNQVLQKARNWQIDTGKLVIEDFGAFPFVIDARVEAVFRQAFPEREPESGGSSAIELAPRTPRDRRRWSRLYIPGNQPKLMINAYIHQPDGIILDLEDSVNPAEKQAARFIVRNALRTLDFGPAERMVRINQGEWGREDLRELIPEEVDLILLPKVEEAQEIQEVENGIREISSRCGRTRPPWLMPILESAKGILHAEEIATASSLVVALAIGLEDYTADLGVERTAEGRESLWARSRLVNAARAAGIQAIDTVFSDVRDEEGLRASVREAKALGFDGKGCIHPRQIRPIHEEFAPTAEELEKARRIVSAYEEAQAQGLGVVSLGSKMIDAPVVKRALQTLKNAGRD
ncbi:MAG: citrate lyase ACP [Candidatus Neomarinimicrobiota bacterium]|nr:MAG: citrate lyase ACP [Candidatus Neomarinimicrobiota bacterium]